MDVKWFAKAQQHWEEQLNYCAETFGIHTALDCVRIAEEMIERICKYPESCPIESLLKDKKMTYRFIRIKNRIKLIYRYDAQQQIIYIVDVWNTRMSPTNLLDRMK
ncbi:MAG: type II toxin-antitoxin system RelE/ParE family toxin [Prevotella sp.]|nr:type II toxin-antitoxin system RelE/ParE family toxin [Prevotella sp.]